VAGGGGADSMLQFQLERESDGMKCCWKMKRRQRVRLGSMEKMRDTVQRCDDVGRRRDDTEEGKGWR
jgi:hypothetical protein